MKDAYYTVSVAAEDWKFLQFPWKGNPHQLTALPHGLGSCPCIFTILLTHCTPQTTGCRDSAVLR